MPDKINGYEILSSIGSGAFGRTYRVKKGGKVYAMKVLKPEAIRTDVDRTRFQREFRALQKIQSEHVVSYHDHGVFDDDRRETYYIVMGYVEGTDLERRLRGRSFPLPEVLRLLEKEPFLRPSCAAEVAELLERTPFFRAEETPASAVEAWSFGRRMCFIRLLHNEKSVVQTFLQDHAIDGVVYQANYVPKYGGQLDVLRSHGVPYLFDPSTNRLPYSEFSETQSLRDLPYVFDKMNRLKPDKLRSISEIRRYVHAVL